MKSIIIKTLLLVAMAAGLLSFTNYGAEGFEISLNNKVIIQRFGNDLNVVQQLKLMQNSANDQLSVKYYHCGRVAKNRVLTITDNQNKIVKEWRFDDGLTSLASPVAMTCKVKDVLNLGKGYETTFKLYYSSSELPGGRLLVNVVMADKTVAANK